MLMQHKDTFQDERTHLAQAFLFLIHLTMPNLLNTEAIAHPSLLQWLNSKTKGAHWLTFTSTSLNTEEQWHGGGGIP